MTTKIAQFTTTCRKCNRWIRVGDEIVYNTRLNGVPSWGWTHATCPLVVGFDPGMIFTVLKSSSPIYTFKEAVTVSAVNKTTLEREIRLREVQLERLKRLKTKLELLKVPLDVYDNGDMIAFERSTTFGTIYTFVAIKQNGYWYSSSTVLGAATWRQMIIEGADAFMSGLETATNIRQLVAR